ncbi:MAG: hypothetical protein IJ343_14800, partial [Clostridia bacterium]|nr:hypothetical protein [Clostridia bacterium]
MELDIHGVPPENTHGGRLLRPPPLLCFPYWVVWRRCCFGYCAIGLFPLELSSAAACFSYCTLLAFPFELSELFDESEIRQRRYGRFASGGQGLTPPLHLRK